VRGADLYYDLELAPWEAVLGATIHIRALDGTESLKIPAGTVAEQQFRLRGKGLPTGKGTRDDLYAIVSIQVPGHLMPEQKAYGNSWPQNPHSTRGRLMKKRKASDGAACLTSFTLQISGLDS